MNTHNVDPQEIAKFNAIAEDWWNPNGQMKPLHLLNPLRMSYLEEFVTLQGKTVLDVGCGGGILTEALARHAQSTTGIDLSQEVLHAAKQHAAQQNLTIDYQEIAVETLALKHPQQFDIITCMEMLEHVPNPESIIQACATLLKPNGWVFFSTIHRNPKSYLFAILGAEYLLKLLPRGTHNYANFIRPSELNEWAENANLNLVDIRGMTYSPFSGTFNLSQDTSVNYLACYRISEK